MSLPNIIYVFPDQLRHSALGCYGNTDVKTPNIDKFCEDALTLDCAFSSCPICSPYRAQIISGLYAHQNGVLDNEYMLKKDIETLPKILKTYDYDTAYIGKWHLGYGPYTEDKRYGFDYMASYNTTKGAFNGEYFENEKGPIKMDKWHPEFETDLAIEYIENHLKTNSEKPFLLMLSHLPPHWPYDTFPKKYDIYDKENLSIPPNVPKALEAFEREELAMYYGNVTGLDVEFGRLLEAVENFGIKNDTIICFTSDHGDHLGAHGFGKPMDEWLHHTKRASKATPYDESIHVPFIVSYPNKIKENSRSDVLFNSVDVMPTLLGLCGLPVPDCVEGTDLSFALKGESGTKPQSCFFQILGTGWPYRGKWVGFWRGVRTQRYVYARWLDNEVEPILFDVIEDKFEMNNLYGKDEFNAVQLELEKMLCEWLEKTNDPFEFGERFEDTRMLKLGQEFTNAKWYPENYYKNNK